MRYFLFFSSNPYVMTWTKALRYQLMSKKNLENQWKVLNQMNAKQLNTTKTCKTEERPRMPAEKKKKILINVYQFSLGKEM